MRRVLCWLWSGLSALSLLLCVAALSWWAGVGPLMLYVARHDRATGWGAGASTERDGLRLGVLSGGPVPRDHDGDDPWWQSGLTDGHNDGPHVVASRSHTVRVLAGFALLCSDYDRASYAEGRA